MATLELPHTAGCLVCGPRNPHGLGLSLQVDTQTGLVAVRFVPRAHHIGFPEIIHGGALALVLDETMVWAASWSGKRFCLCGEMNIRYRAAANVAVGLTCRAKVDSARVRLITTSAEILDDSGRLIASATGKYVPLSQEQNRVFLETFIDEPATAPAAEALRAAG
jgi:acyl-coenzyme A thioesterase PaaI-like protein